MSVRTVCVRQAQQQEQRAADSELHAKQRRAGQEAELAAEYNRAVCEAQARVSPVFFLWYEDLLADPEPLFAELQRFLGVPVRPLTSTVQRIVAPSTDKHSFIQNLEEVRQAAASLRLDLAKRTGSPLCNARSKSRS